MLAEVEDAIGVAVELKVDEVPAAELDANLVVALVLVLLLDFRDVKVAVVVFNDSVVEFVISLAALVLDEVGEVAETGPDELEAKDCAAVSNVEAPV